jgi:hypothetical protein
MDAAVPFERWQLRLGFSLAIFRLNYIDCAIGWDLIARKLTSNAFANWLLAELYLTQKSVRCLNWESAASP